jgi:ribonuclease-3
MEERTQPNLAYRFRDPRLLARALTHRSLGPDNNERLEFLGDSVLGFVISDLLFTRNPAASEGRLTRMRAALVRRDTLAAIARELELGPSLRLGSGELKSGGHDRASILADAYEALVGAIYIDGGAGAAREFIERTMGDRFDEIRERTSLKDPKTLLQELLQKRGLPVPNYTLVGVSGEAHRQQFQVECAIEGIAGAVRGEGTSRRQAEQRAAEAALDLMGRDSD